jgi:hypothetical protein
MSTKTSTSKYLVIWRGARFDESFLSAEEIQNAMKQFNAWFERMSDQGKMKGAHLLAPEGKILSARKGDGRPVCGIQGRDSRLLVHSSSQS